MFFYLDERIVSFDSEESNYNLTKRLFLNELIENKLIEEKQILTPLFSTSYLKDIKEFHI
jgi:6-phosphogluconolactonase/glucosamine-6-phosphate isomerase/deaminase